MTDKSISLGAALVRQPRPDVAWRNPNYHVFSLFDRPVQLTLGVFAIILSSLIVLYATGFCFSRFRYYSDAELIDIVIKWNLTLHKPDSERDKIYPSLDEFHKLNPNCCRVHKTGHWMLSGPGAGDVIVNVHYKISDSAARPSYYDSHVRIGSCGNIRETGGTIEQQGPRRR